MSAKLLLVDDDRFLLDNMKRYLAGQGFDIQTAPSAEEAMVNLMHAQPDLMVLDLGLPGADGITFCRRVRSMHKFPIIMLTARSDSMDKVVGLEVGADDYLTKPFEPVELVARIRAQLRRSTEYQGPETVAAESLTFADVHIDADARSVTAHKKAVHLTSKEFDLLYFLAKNEGRVLDRDTIFDKVWGYDSEFNTNSLDVIIYRLRKKIERDANQPEYLFTVRGYGYKFESPSRR